MQGGHAVNTNRCTGVEVSLTEASGFLTYTRTHPAPYARSISSCLSGEGDALHSNLPYCRRQAWAHCPRLALRPPQACTGTAMVHRAGERQYFSRRSLHGTVTVTAHAVPSRESTEASKCAWG